MVIKQKIDMHVHTFLFNGINTYNNDTTYASPEELIGMYEKLGVSKGVILPEIAIEGTSRQQSNEEVMAVVEKYPDKFDWFCNIDPRMGDNNAKMNLSYFLEYYKGKGAKGLGEICANLPFVDPFVQNLFYHCEKCNMPVVFHIGTQKGDGYGLIDDIGLPGLEQSLVNFPNLKFFGHSQPFWSEIGIVNKENRGSYPNGKVIPGRLVDLMEKYPNLYGDLSAGSGFNAVSRDSEFGCGFIEKYSENLLYGTDICSPTNDMKLSHWLDEMLEKGNISQKAYDNVSYKNALEILKGR